MASNQFALPIRDSGPLPAESVSSVAATVTSLPIIGPSHDTAPASTAASSCLAGATPAQPAPLSEEQRRKLEARRAKNARKHAQARARRKAGHPALFDRELTDSGAAHITYLLVRVVQDNSIVTEAISMRSSDSRSMNSLCTGVERELKEKHRRTWEVVSGKFGQDMPATKLRMQKTVGKGVHRWLEASWDVAGQRRYANWYFMNVTSGRNTGLPIKVEIHFSEAQNAEYLGPIKETSEADDDEETIMPVKRTLRRFVHIFEQRDLVEQEIAEKDMLLPPMTTQERRLRYTPKEEAYASSTYDWLGPELQRPEIEENKTDDDDWEEDEMDNDDGNDYLDDESDDKVDWRKDGDKDTGDDEEVYEHIDEEDEDAMNIDG